jgi:hypothetical protein
MKFINTHMTISYNISIYIYIFHIDKRQHFLGFSKLLVCQDSPFYEDLWAEDDRRGPLNRWNRWALGWPPKTAAENMAVWTCNTNSQHIYWLVVTGTWMDYDFPHIGKFIIPTDELIFFRVCWIYWKLFSILEGFFIAIFTLVHAGRIWHISLLNS